MSEKIQRFALIDESNMTPAEMLERPDGDFVTYTDYQALASAGKQGEWMPIESAPRDGTAIYVWHEKYKWLHPVIWDKHQQDWKVADGHFCSPTHWHIHGRIPEPPSEGTGRAQEEKP